MRLINLNNLINQKTQKLKNWHLKKQNYFLKEDRKVLNSFESEIFPIWKRHKKKKLKY